MNRIHFINRAFGLSIVFGCLAGLPLGAQTLFDVDQWQENKAVEMKLSFVWVPPNLDANDTHEFIVETETPDGCWEKPSLVLTEHLEGTKTHFQFHLEARPTSPDKCSEEKKKRKNVPHIIVYKFEKSLAKGSYELWHPSNKEKSVGTLVIKEIPASSSKDRADDFVYAIVRSAILQPDGLEPKSFVLTLIGKHTNSCDEIDLQKTVVKRVVDSSGHETRLFEVLPILRRVETPEKPCVDGKFDFVTPLRVSYQLSPDHYMFHVRTFDGGSENFPFEVQAKL